MTPAAAYFADAIVSTALLFIFIGLVLAVAWLTLDALIGPTAHTNNTPGRTNRGHGAAGRARRRGVSR